ncbi:MAG: hypothetical protein FVQ84_08325 [Planctomycetes bacterium]|nr:hypothetical protein [Planctomycetota bacterium]
MPIIKDYPKLKGFTQHGVVFEKIVGDERAIGICPFCNKKDKFDSHVETLIWGCKSCGINGNFEKFMEYRSQKYTELFKGQHVRKLSKDRSLKPQTLRAFDVGWSGLFYTYPIRGNSKQITTDIQRYTIGKKILSTSGSHKSLIVPKELFNSQRVWLMEGGPDTMACWEALQKLGRKEDVYGSPGAASFPNKLADLFYRKNVVVIFDNDDAGKRGSIKIFKVLIGIAKQIRFIHWPDSIKDKFDFRDCYNKYKQDAEKTIKFIERNLKTLPPVPEGETLQEPSKIAAKQINPSGEGLSRDKAVEGFRKWLLLKDSEVIDVMFGAVFANRMEIDPLWMFLVAPPGGSKSELLMSLTDAPLIIAKTTITPASLVSGMNTGSLGDPSLIPRLDKHVLVIKDFTTILSMNIIQREEIFGVLRDAYDGEFSKDFGNGIRREYKSKFGIIAGVTPIIEGFSNSNTILGERFIKYKIKYRGRIDVGRDVIRRALNNIKKVTPMRDELKIIASKVLDRPISTEDSPTINESRLNGIIKLSQWIANLRGVVSRERYTGQINFKPVAEIGTRLAKQLCTLAFGISYWKGDSSVSDSTYQTIINVACDTAPDRVEEIVRQIYIRQVKLDQFISVKELSSWTRFPEGTVRYLLQDLTLLGITKRNQKKRSHDWKLTSSIMRIMNELGIYKNLLSWADVTKQ